MPVIYACSICQINFIYQVVSNESGLVWVARRVSSSEWVFWVQGLVFWVQSLVLLAHGHHVHRCMLCVMCCAWGWLTSWLPTAAPSPDCEISLWSITVCLSLALRYSSQFQSTKDGTVELTAQMWKNIKGERFKKGAVGRQNRKVVWTLLWRKQAFHKRAGRYIDFTQMVDTLGVLWPLKQGIYLHRSFPLNL